MCQDEQCPQPWPRVRIVARCCPLHRLIRHGVINVAGMCGPGKRRKSKEGLHARFRQHTGQALAERLQAKESLKPSLTPAMALAYVYAELIHAFTLSCGVTGVFLIVYWHSLISIPVGVLLVTLFWCIRPRLGELPLSTLSPKASRLV